MKRLLPSFVGVLALLAVSPSCSSSYRSSDSSTTAAGSTAAAVAPDTAPDAAGGTPGTAAKTAGATPAPSESMRVGAPTLRLEPVVAWVVRHAEAEEDGTPDPALSAAGRARANDLRDRLRPEGLRAIYASPYRRARETARPLARALGLEVHEYDPRDSKALAVELFQQHRGDPVLVVGHSNTVPQIVEALGGARPPDLAHGEYDALFIVRATGTGAEVTRLRYGAASDTTTAR